MLPQDAVLLLYYVRMMSKKPAELVRNAVIEQMYELKLNHDQINLLITEIPRKWEKHGDLIIFPHKSLRNHLWSIFGNRVYEVICKILKINRIARKNPVEPNVFRSSNVDLLWGDSGIVYHVDNKIKYQWDITKCMFSIGNISEKLRIAEFNCENEVVVDLFAGIGYFVLPYLIHAKAKHVHACEINPDSVEALIINLKANKVYDKCTVHIGDNRVTCPENVADRINLGLIPSSELSWETACRALKDKTGGVMHIHVNVDSKFGNRSSGDTIFKYREWEVWTNRTISKIQHLLVQVKKNQWEVHFLHLEHVKSYAPHVDHLVLDIHCKPCVEC